jgi:hypothetical protein
VPDPAQQARLRSIKLTALVRDHGIDISRAAPGEYAGGAAMLVDGVAWVLAEDQPERALGAAVAWGARRHARAVELLVGDEAGLVARRAAAFSVPVQVWVVDERRLVAAEPEPLPPPAALPEHHLELRPLIVEAGAEPNVEHGVLTGEVEGLEVCRVVDDPDTGTTRLEVGVGAHDRELFQLVHGDRPTVDALADVVSAVAEHRRANGGLRHPLNGLAPERAMRAALVRDPSPLGATWLRAEPPPVPRRSLKDTAPCVAIAGIDGVEHTVVVSHGVDLDVVPFAIDARVATGVGPTVVAARRCDLLPVQELLAAAVREPLRMVALD